MSKFSEINISQKKYGKAVILSGIFGVIGIHHFYLGRILMGFLDFGLFIATLLFIYIFDTLIIGVTFFTIDLIHTVIVTYWLLTGQYKDGEGKLVTFPGQKIN